MHSIRSISPVVRAVFVIGAVAALVTSITFAALSDTAEMTDNQFTTATAELKIWDPVGSIYVNSITGFNFTNVEPDVETAPYTFWLKNEGGVALNVTVESNVPTFSNVADPDLVDLEFTNLTAGGSPVTYSVQELYTGGADLMPENPLDPNEENQYAVTVLVDSSTVSGQSASMTNLDLTFTGTDF